MGKLQLTVGNPELRVAANAVRELGKYERVALKIAARLEPFAISPRVRDAPIVTKKSELYKYKAIRQELIWWIQNTEVRDSAYQREKKQLRDQVSVYAATISKLSGENEKLHEKISVLESNEHNVRIRCLEKINEQLVQDNLKLKAEIESLSSRLEAVADQSVSAEVPERSDIINISLLVINPPTILWLWSFNDF